MWAAWMRRARPREARSCSSQSRRVGTQESFFTSSRWASRPCRPRAVARLVKDSARVIFVLLFEVEGIVGGQGMRGDQDGAQRGIIGQMDADGRRQRELTLFLIEQEMDIVDLRVWQVLCVEERGLEL